VAQNFTKWGKWEKILLNGVNNVISVKLGGKNWNKFTTSIRANAVSR
jgi:hypothetical protein